MFETRKLTKYFGGLAAIVDFDIQINKGEILGLIGPNGAGKTTVFNLISGFLQPTRGQILFKQQDLTGLPAHLIAEKGIVRTFQAATYFPDFTVLQNVVVSCHLHPDTGFWQAIFNTPGYKKKEEYKLNRTMEILQFLGLDAVKAELARNLSHGHQRMLGIAIALAVNPDPKLLLLDEPLAGMSPAEVDWVLKIMGEIKNRGTAILLVEHNMRAVMNICDRLVVLNFGVEIASGSPAEVRQNKDVIQAYLGVKENAA